MSVKQSNKVRLVASVSEDNIVYPSGVYEVGDLPDTELIKKFTVAVVELPNVESKQVDEVSEIIATPTVNLSVEPTSKVKGTKTALDS